MSVKLQFDGSEKVSEKIFALPAAEFAADVLKGLTANPKSLSSMYFYDDAGDKIFQEIMAMDEYYLTNAEFQVFNDRYKGIISGLADGGEHFQLLEFGAGDGYKTKVLLKHFLEEGLDFRYCPIDISGSVLEHLTHSLHQELPQLRVEALQGDYFQVLDALKKENQQRKVVMFLGSNIGNFPIDQAGEFLSSLAANLSSGDRLIIGIDLKKDPRVILKAYDDPAGITRSFNLNLLNRINRELDADFDLSQFDHYASYNPETGECRSYLMSKSDQVVTIGALDQKFEFKSWEQIHMEISRKYSLSEIDQLAARAGFEVVDHLMDESKYFVDSIWKVA